tara:strand:+ start:4857 stop:5135 length:279 start_codon:yes stop_codon:yes gene_type:complete
MSTVEIAKSQLQRLTSKTKRHIFLLEFGDCNFTPLTEETYNEVKHICRKEKIKLPLMKRKEEISINVTTPNLYGIILDLARGHDIILDVYKI